MNKIIYAMIDIEGYSITEKMKKTINSMIEKNNTKNILRNQKLLTNEADFFQIGVEIFELDFTDAPKINRISSENFVRLDPILYDKELAKSLFLFGRRNILALMDKSILCKTHKEMKDYLNSYLKKYNVTTIIGYGELEKKYLTQVNINTVSNPESYLELQDVNNRGYYYLDMSALVELMLKDDLKNKQNIIKIMEEKTYYTETYKEYSTKAESIFKTLLEYFQLTNKDEINRTIAMQLYTGNRDAKIQTWILESLLRYDYENPSKILYKLFARNNPQKITEGMIELKEEYSKTSLNIKYQKLPFGNMPSAYLYSKDDFHKVYRFILENFNVVTYGNNKSKSSFNNEIFFRQTLTFYNSNKKEYSLSKNLLKEIFLSLKSANEKNGDTISIRYDRNNKLIYISINEEKLLATVNVCLFNMDFVDSIITYFDTGKTANTKYLNLFNKIFYPSKEGLKELEERIATNTKKGILKTEETQTKQTKTTIYSELSKNKVKINKNNKEFNDALNLVLAYNDISKGDNLIKSEYIKVSRTEPKGTPKPIILNQSNFINAFELFLQNYSKTKLNPNLINDIINGKVFLVDTKKEKEDPVSVPNAFVNLLSNRKVAKISNTLTTKKSKKIYFYI